MPLLKFAFAPLVFAGWLVVWGSVALLAWLLALLLGCLGCARAAGALDTVARSWAGMWD